MTIARKQVNALFRGIYILDGHTGRLSYNMHLNCYSVYLLLFYVYTIIIYKKYVKPSNLIFFLYLKEVNQVIDQFEFAFVRSENFTNQKVQSLDHKVTKACIQIWMRCSAVLKYKMVTLAGLAVICIWIVIQLIYLHLLCVYNSSLQVIKNLSPISFYPF